MNVVGPVCLHTLYEIHLLLWRRVDSMIDLVSGLSLEKKNRVLIVKY